MIQFIISERQVYRNEAVREISKRWAGPQTVAGPLITLVTNHEHINKDGTKSFSTKRTFYLPENLSVEANVIPEKRYRGIYSAIVYKTDLIIKGDFNFQKFKEKLDDPNLVESYLSFNIDDPRGIQQNIKVKWDDVVQSVNPGLKDKNVFKNGFNSAVIINKEKSFSSFEINLTLNGVDDLNFVPMSKNTNVSVSSSWGNPSFIGNFLPAKAKHLIFICLVEIGVPKVIIDRSNDHIRPAGDGFEQFLRAGQFPLALKQCFICQPVFGNLRDINSQ